MFIVLCQLCTYIWEPCFVLQKIYKSVFYNVNTFSLSNQAEGHQPFLCFLFPPPQSTKVLCDILDKIISYSKLHCVSFWKRTNDSHWGFYCLMPSILSHCLFCRPLCTMGAILFDVLVSWHRIHARAAWAETPWSPGKVSTSPVVPAGRKMNHGTLDQLRPWPASQRQYQREKNLTKIAFWKLYLCHSQTKQILTWAHVFLLRGY